MFRGTLQRSFERHLQEADVHVDGNRGGTKRLMQPRQPSTPSEIAAVGGGGISHHRPGIGRPAGAGAGR